MRVLAVLSFVLCINAFSYAQEGKTIEHIIQSEAFGKERKIYVHLPKKYFNYKTDSFMVVYVLDAQSDQYWNMATSNMDYLVNTHKVVPMIAVGVVSDHRGKEFVPVPKNGSSFEGTAHLLRQHLQEEIFPLIAANYRINEGRAIVGHSRGGAFITATLFSEHKDMFDAYLGISPAIYYFDHQIFNEAVADIKKGKTYKKFLYYSHGDVGKLENKFSKDVKQMDSVLQQYPTPSLVWEWDYFPNTDHWSVVIPSWNFGLLRMTRHLGVDQKLIQDFAKDKSKSIKEHAQQYYQTKILDYAVHPPLRMLDYYGREFNEMEQFEEAIELYDWVLEMDPNYIRSHRNKGWVYEQQEDFAKAEKAYRAALASLEAQKDTLEPEDYASQKKSITRDINDAVKGQQ